ncbi:MAG: LytTR family transcriptional regulator [Hespellia sp.]|nr:LytTR family transcriptional regulator [Hespellia sp.]
MKLIWEQIIDGEEEVIIRYRVRNAQIDAIAAMVQGTRPKIQAEWEGRTTLFWPEEIYYLENVDGVTYGYLENRVVRIPQSLKSLEKAYENQGFFRCSKAMIINIYKIDFLKSEPGSRIRATLENGEQVMISRKYAKVLRQILKGEGGDE